MQRVVLRAMFVVSRVPSCLVVGGWSYVWYFLQANATIYAIDCKLMPFMSILKISVNATDNKSFV
jgi:hypothetical protein